MFLINGIALHFWCFFPAGARNIIGLPGHIWVPQLTVSSASPTQSLPLPFLGGLLHSLVLVLVPPPHVFEHSEYKPHALHLPFTEITIIFNHTLCLRRVLE